MNIKLYKKDSGGLYQPTLNLYYSSTPKNLRGLFYNLPGRSEYYIKGEISEHTLNVDTEEADDTEGMFAGQTKITSVKVKFPKTKNCSLMFGNCTSLEIVDSDFSSLTGKDEIYGGTPQTSTDKMFYGCTALKTFKGSLKSLKNADNLFNDCTGLTTFESDLSSLESAAGFCTKAKLSVSSVANIASNIKPHSEGTHKISLGINCTENAYSSSQYVEHINNILSKGWTVEYSCNA